jgi:hypothetical protein
MTKEIIINYYNSLDFIDIINCIEPDFKITVYNKSSNIIGDLDNEILVENIGRESHTYLNHIINNYDNLSDITIFIQDDFCNHLFNFDYFNDKLNLNQTQDFYQFPCSWRIGYGIISRNIVNGYLDLFTLPNNNSIKEFSETFNINLPVEYTTETCAHFLVSKDRILKHSKEKYKKILEWVLSDERNGYTMEHTWKLLFM